MIAPGVRRRPEIWAALSIVALGVLVIGLPSTTGGFVGGLRTSSGAGVNVAPSLAPPLSVCISVTPNPVNQGSQFSVNAVVAGGVSPYSYSWFTIPTGCPSVGNTSAWQCTLGQSGSYPVDVRVTDHNGTQNTGSQTITVSSTGGGGGGGSGSKNNGSNGFNLSGFGPYLYYGLIAGVVGFGLLIALTVGVIAIAVILSRRLPRPPRDGIVCGSCQATAPAGSKFCPACASPLTPKP